FYLFWVSQFGRYADPAFAANGARFVGRIPCRHKVHVFECCHLLAKLHNHPRQSPDPDFFLSVCASDPVQRILFPELFHESNRYSSAEYRLVSDRSLTYNRVSRLKGLPYDDCHTHSSDTLAFRYTVFSLKHRRLGCAV